MGQDPDAIRHEVEHTREQMGETIDALGYKADVKTRTKERIGDTVDGVKERMGMATSKVSDATPDTEQVKQGARRAAGMAQENPLGLAVGATAVGFLAGMLIPSSRVEDEKLGPMADQLKQQAKETGEEALERGKQVAQSAAQSAAETVREEGRQQGEQLAESARENAEHARGNATSVSR
jgi:gas vesicle protein